MIRERSVAPTRLQQRFAGAFAAGIAGIALLTSLSVGPASWLEFVDNSRTHLETDTLNVTGLRPLLAYRHDARLAVTVDARSPDTYARWREARRASFAARRPLFALIVAGYLVLLVLALRRKPDWVAGILGIGMLPVLLEVSSYYFGVLLAFACLWPRRVVVVLMLLAAAWGTGTWTGPDRDQHTALMSLGILLFVLYATTRMAWTPWENSSARRWRGHLRPATPMSSRDVGRWKSCLLGRLV